MMIFEPTPLMSSYLFVCIVGKFERLEVTPTNDGIIVGGYTPEGYSQTIRVFLEVMREALEFYSNYFGIPFPLKKMDIVSLHTMNVRAMENWGCITFNRHVILTDVKNSSAQLVQRNARSVAHELAHMWFGNLVTPEWWDDIWLNEGFARYAEHHILNTLRPQFRSWDKYMEQVYRVALNKDSQISKTHPV